MGIETVNEGTLSKIRKGATTTTDREAVRLLRQHDILSQVAYLVGFEEETDRDYLHGMRQLLTYWVSLPSWAAETLITHGSTFGEHAKMIA